MDISTWIFEIAQGRATATMSRGKFKHRDRVSSRRTLELSVIESDEHSTVFSLVDPATKQSCTGRVEMRTESGSAVAL